MKRLSRTILIPLLWWIFTVIAFDTGLGQQRTHSRPEQNVPQNRLARAIRHELIAVPHYTVFDNLQFQLDGTRVTLLGQVTRPALKSEAAKAVNMEGISGLDNRIMVLPVSPHDDELRLQLFRIIDSNPMLEKYAIQTVRPIHIIVNNGDVTLEGVVASESEKNQAELETSAVPGVRSLKNNLRIEPQAP
jgi:hyperosmotically inducible protein